MSSCLVRCTIHGCVEDPDKGRFIAFYSADALSVSVVRSKWPLEGHFHFRAKVRGQYCGMPNVSFLWLDLVSDDALIPEWQDNVVILQALPITLPEPLCAEESMKQMEFYDYQLKEAGILRIEDRQTQHDDYSGYLQRNLLDTASTIKGAASNLSKGVTSAASTAWKNTTLGADKAITVAQTAASSASKVTSSIFSSVSSFASSASSNLTQAASGIFGANEKNNVLSEQAEENLARLGELIEDKLCNSNEHSDLLENLWVSFLDKLDGSTPFVRHGRKWRLMGWQTDDPALDLKQSGTLAIRSMIHMAHHYPDKSVIMLSRNRENTKNKYPFAIVGVNITLLLADLLQLKAQGYLGLNKKGFRPRWELFEDPISFYEIFVICFIYMDFLWTQSDAVRSDFGKLVQQIKTTVLKVLAKEPNSLYQFKLIASEEGM